MGDPGRAARAFGLQQPVPSLPLAEHPEDPRLGGDETHLARPGHSPWLSPRLYRLLLPHLGPAQTSPSSAAQTKAQPGVGALE